MQYSFLKKSAESAEKNQTATFVFTLMLIIQLSTGLLLTFFVLELDKVIQKLEINKN